MTQLKFNVASRDLGVKSKKLRKEGFAPANIYGAGKKSTSAKIDSKKFLKLYEQAGETSLVYLQVDDGKNKIPVLIDDVQKDVLTKELLHVSFKQVDLKDKIKAEIPVVIVGEFDVQNAVLVTVKDAIEVEALPTDFPENFEINIEKLTEIGQVITLADLDYDREKVEIILGEDGEESPVVIVQELRVATVEEEAGETQEAEQGAGEEGTDSTTESPSGE